MPQRGPLVPQVSDPPSKFPCCRLGQPNHSCLGGSIVCLPHVPHLQVHQRSGVSQESQGLAFFSMPTCLANFTPTQPDLSNDATDVDDGAMTTTGHQGLGCSLSD
jgi:hypothetical protein